MLDLKVWTHHSCLSISLPLAHEIVDSTKIGTQFPYPSLVYPDGKTDGKEDELGTQFPFLSLRNQEANKTETESATHFPFP